MMQPNSADVITGLTDEQRAEVAPKLTKIERTLAERQKFYVEVIEGPVWALGSAAGRATPQAKELIRFIKEIRK